MKILVFGQNGQVARELAGLLPTVKCVGRADADLDDPVASVRTIQTFRPDVVINAAAFTDVDRAEEEEALATAINGAAAAAMARTCADLRLPLIQISTDFVFDGSGHTYWAPDDTTAPINAYGRSKLAGEQGVRASGCPYVILRTSWVFSAHGRNFVSTMLRLGAKRDELSIGNGRDGDILVHNWIGE